MAKKTIFIDDLTLLKYRTAAEKIMQIADDDERQEQIIQLIGNMIDRWPELKDLGFSAYYVEGQRNEMSVFGFQKVKKIVLRWADYRNLYEKGFIEINGFDVEGANDEGNNLKEFALLLKVLSTEWALLDGVKKLVPPDTHTTPDTAAGVSYKSNRDEAELTAIFNALTGKTKPQDTKEKDVVKYLPADSDLQGWLWICTGRLGKQPKEPLKWLGTPTELALMVGTLFGNKWKVTLTWFIYNSDVDGQWKQPTDHYLSKQFKAGDRNGIENRSYLWKILKPFCPETQD